MDSDNHGISDNNETFNNGTTLHYWYQDYDGDGRINAVDPDSDDDLLYDGLERGYKPGDASVDTNLLRPYFIPDPDHCTTNPYDADTDGDNIKDGIEDANQNGRIDGDNGDGIYSDNECWEEMSPNLIDSDGDSFTDSEEKQWGYNPLSTDTDNDGIADNVEDSPTSGTQGQMDEGETNPKEMDTDKDGLTDSQEINGWTIVITYEATGEIVSRYNVYSDPREVHSDEDGITDYEEFQNATDPTKIDTDGDGWSDWHEIKLNLSSRPTGIDGKPPEIYDFDCWYDATYEKFLGVKLPNGIKLVTKVTVRDLFGVYGVQVKIDGLGVQCAFTNDIMNVTVEFEWKVQGWDNIKKTIWEGFKINITAKDRNGNLGFKEEEQPGIAQLVMSALLGALLAYVKFITELVSGIFEWLWNMISSMVEKTISSILNIMNEIRNFAKRITNPFVDYFFSGFNDNSALIVGVNQLLDYIFNPILFTLVGALMLTLAVIAIIITGVTFGTAEIITQAISFIITILVVIMSTKDEKENDSGDPNGFTSYLLKTFKIENSEVERTKFSLFDDTQIVDNARIDNLLKGIILTGGLIFIYVITFMANGHYKTPPGYEKISLKLTFFDHLIFWAAMGLAIISTIISMIAADFIIEAGMILDESSPPEGVLDYRKANAELALVRGIILLIFSLIVLAGSSILNAISPLVCAQPGMVKAISWSFTGIAAAVFALSILQLYYNEYRICTFDS